MNDRNVPMPMPVGAVCYPALSKKSCEQQQQVKVPMAHFLLLSVYSPAVLLLCPPFQKMSCLPFFLDSKISCKKLDEYFFNGRYFSGIKFGEARSPFECPKLINKDWLDLQGRRKMSFLA
jgi:hypothetical protein